VRRILPLAVFLVVVVSAIGFATSGGPSPSIAAPLNAVGGYISSPHPAVSIYVSPSGSDRNLGTYSRPLQTLTHARDFVRRHNRNMRGNIAVYLEKGIYQLRRPLQLGPRDSGTNGHNVVWSTVRGQSAMISGSVRISGWRLVDSRRNIWAATVPRGLDTRQIYVNGMRATLASGPAPVNLTRTATGYRASSSLMAHWRNPSRIDFVYTGQLGEHVEPICSVGAIRGTVITMAEPCWDDATRRALDLVGAGNLSSPAYVENAYELLDQPGQFYLDRRAAKLYYIPRKREDLRKADVEAPVLQTLLTGRGSGRARIHNITFSNLQFSYATWLQPASPEGFAEVQAGYTLTGLRGYAREGLCQFVAGGTCPFGAWTKEPGNIQFSFDQRISFLNDRFVHLGATALNLANGSQGDVVEGCVFTDISGNGIDVGGVNLPDAAGAAQTRGVSVVNNHLYGLADEYHGGVAILVGYAADTIISHNQIDHVPYTSISMGWGGWPDKIHQASVPNFSHDNVVSDNLVYDFVQMLTDGGGIYTLGITGASMASGEKVSGNVVYDQLDWSFALHSDNGATYVTYERNVLYNNVYDWCCDHPDWRLNPGGSHPLAQDPQVVVDNYWQQGPGRFPSRTQIGNQIIDGPGQGPASITTQAGIQRRFRFILRWRPAGESVPSPPERVGAVYALGGKVYVIWHPSTAPGNRPITSYTVHTCNARAGLPEYPCRHHVGKPTTISASHYKSSGYLVVSGLKSGTAYTFTVTAHSRAGSSTPSVPSPVIIPSASSLARPARPLELKAQPGRNVVRLLWYPPNGIDCTGHWWAIVCHRPVLAYIVKSSTGRTYRVSRLEMVIANTRGKQTFVVGGLRPGRRYSFSISAVTPAGVGPASKTPAVRAL
jgi:Fibronectin type III domain